MDDPLNKINSMASELGLVVWSPQKINPPKIFRCYECVEEDNDISFYTWKVLRKHKHKLKYYAEVTHLFTEIERINILKEERADKIKNKKTHKKCIACNWYNLKKNKKCTMCGGRYFKEAVK